MIFYINKQTNEIIGICGMLDLITSPTEQSIKLGYKGYASQVAYLAIYPNKILGNGILSYAITHKFLRENYKRIRKQLAYERYPNFKQYRHSDMVIEAKKLGVDGIDVLRKQTV